MPPSNNTRIPPRPLSPPRPLLRQAALFLIPAFVLLWSSTFWGIDLVSFALQQWQLSDPNKSLVFEQFEQDVQRLLVLEERKLEQEFSKRVRAEAEKRLQPRCAAQQKANKNATKIATKPLQNQKQPKNYNNPLAPLQDVVLRMAATPRTEFFQNLGLPMSYEEKRAHEPNVLMIYGDLSLAPNALRDQTLNYPFTIPKLNQSDALARCDKLHIYPMAEQSLSCLALVPHHGPGHHLQHWMRVAQEHLPNQKDMYETMTNSKTKELYPLRLVSAAFQKNGMEHFGTPSQTNNHAAFDLFVRYFEAIDQVKADLQALFQLETKSKNRRKKTAEKPIKASPPGPRVQPYDGTTVIVMACNAEQSDMLLNFVCTARARKFELKSLLVFATDAATRDLCHALGIASYHNEKMFGSASLKAVQIMSLQLVLNLGIMTEHDNQFKAEVGFDVLFQDLDTTWFQHPLKDYFYNSHKTPTTPSKFHDEPPFDQYDIIFQEDGSRSLYFEPFDANAGFFMVHRNDRSVAFANALVMTAMPLLPTTKYVSQIVVEVLSQHVTMHGLRAKVISMDSPDLPNAMLFQRQTKHMRTYMMDVMQNKTHPIMFHMSWFWTKPHRIHLLQQMGEWYAQPTCLKKDGGGTTISKLETALTDCCSAEPLLQCHYRDLPSRKPCPDSPPLRDGASFWSPDDIKNFKG